MAGSQRARTSGCAELRYRERLLRSGLPVVLSCPARSELLLLEMVTSETGSACACQKRLDGENLAFGRTLTLEERGSFKNGGGEGRKSLKHPEIAIFYLFFWLYRFQK